MPYTFSCACTFGTKFVEICHAVEAAQRLMRFDTLEHFPAETPKPNFMILMLKILLGCGFMHPEPTTPNSKFYLKVL